MATIFPASPTVGQVYQGYEWNGTAWIIIGIDLTQDYATQTELNNHESDTTNVHGIVNTAVLATQTYADTAASTAVANLVDSAPSTLNTLNELAAALGDDANFATTVTNSLSLKAPLASPTFTGIPAAPTASAGTNTTQVATTAYVRAELTYETTTDLTVSANATTMDVATGNVGFVASGPTANWTVNFTNVPAVNGQTITATIFVTQGATGYIPATVQIGGVGQTIKWQGGSAPTPTSSSGKIDVFSFSMIRRGSAWTVLGSMLGNF